MRGAVPPDPLRQPEVAAALRKIRTRDGREPEAEVQRDSLVCLQNHISDVWFRNIRLRRLD